MKGIVITAKDQAEYKFIVNLLKKLRISSTTMSQDEMEDIGLLQLMNAVNRTKKVSRDTIMSKLKS